MEYLIPQPDGRQVRLKDVQIASLEILKDFDAFCSQYNLHYTLCGGCCIGALRNQGFIPWDDDVDVHMFRQDYERFYELWQNKGNHTKYELCRTSETDFQDTMLTQLSRNHTTFIKKDQINQDINHGIKLEIIPLDGAPTSNIKRKIQLFHSLLFYLYNRGFAPLNRGRIAGLVGRILLLFHSTPKSRVRAWKRHEKAMTKYNIEDCDYVTELTVTWKYMKIRYPKIIFEGERRAPFEDGLYPIPFQAERYLQMAFGDYMKLPPKSEQIPKHDTAFIDLQHSYLDYKGIYYLTNE
jgi:lipopolysaccharide cholinephosphotransferase